MRIYITGSNGFLAQKFCELIVEKDLPYVLYGVSKSPNRNKYLSHTQFEQLNLQNFDDLRDSLNHFAPTHILHSAAVTSVESCEADKDTAYHVNVKLTEYLANYAKDKNVHLTFLSTDFVFDGLNGPYQENDPTKPLNYYGETKVIAEQLIGNVNKQAVILRTILVYGAIPDSSRNNLVLWVKNQLEKNNNIRVVHDQWRMPTWVDDLAQACILAMKRNASGVYHISGEEMMSIKEAALLVANTLSLDVGLISDVSAMELDQDMNRPRRTGFVLTKSKNELGYQPTAFINSLHYICKQLKNYGR